MSERQGAVGIFTTDRDLVIRTWDAGLETLTGISPGDAKGKVLTSLFPEIGARGLKEPLERVLQSGVVEVLAPAFHHYLIECVPLPPSQRFTKMQQRVTIAPLREEASIVGLIVTIEDVTARIEQESLANVLADEDWRNRKKAVEDLAQQNTDEVVKTLLASFRDEHRNLAVLNSALQVLVMSGWDVVNPLAEFLRGDDVDLRIYAALALGEQASAQAIGPLTSALHDPDHNVRFHAIEALGKLRASETTEALIEIVRQRDFFLSFAAIEALAAIKDPRCAPMLLELLDDNLLGMPAAETLGKLGEIAAVRPLSRLLNTEAMDPLTVARALTALFDRYQKDYGEGVLVSDLASKHIDISGARRLIVALSTARDESLRAIALVIGWLEGEDIDRALIALLSEPTVRKEVVKALIRHGRKVSDLVIEQLGAEDLETRLAAVTILGKLGDPKAVGPLVKVLTKDAELTVAAADALAKIGDRSAYQSLLELIGDNKASVRQAAVGAINSLGHPDMAAQAVGLLNSPDPFVRESAVRIAGYFAYPQCIEILIERSSDADENVQRAAIEHLPYIGDQRSVPILLDRLGHASPKIRAAAAQALGELEDKRIFGALIGRLKDPDPWVRYYAVRSLARKGAEKTLSLLGELAEQDDATFVRIAAIEAMGSVGAEALKRLKPLAASDDPDIAKSALEALGKTRVPDAIPPILEAAHARDSERRLNAATALGKYGGTESVKVLQWLGADADPRVSGAAVKRLALMATPDAIAALIGLIGEKSCGEAAAAALIELDEKHWGAIAAGLKHPQPHVRSAIVGVFGRLKHPNASQWIARALDDDMAFVRLAAVNALSRAGNTEHKHRLILLAQQDPDIRVRQAARRVMEPSN